MYRRTVRNPVALLGVALLVVGAALVGVGMSARRASARVPDATPDTSVITVKVGSDRDPVIGASPLTGAVLRLASYPSGELVSAGWAECVSDADGDCSFAVPDTAAVAPNNANNGSRFYVEESAAPPGYFANNVLALGPLSPTTSNPVRDTGYRFLTPPMAGGQTYESGRDFMTANTPNPNPNPSTNAGYQVSSGVVQMSRDDPNVTNCGLKVALIVDLSSSVSGQQNNLKSAARAMVAGLTGTPSSVAVYWFSTNATRVQPLTSVATSADAAPVNSAITNLPNPNGYTNWDAAFSEVAKDGETADYNLAVMITDGNPTVNDANQGTVPTQNASTRFTTLENGIFSANRLKAQRTRVAAFGVGAGLTGGADNLRAITGDGNYFQESNYEQAAAELKQLVLGACKPTVSVVKKLLPAGATSTADATPGAGWTFTAAASGSGATMPAAHTTAADTGATNFPIHFPDGTPANATTNVSLAEEPQSGYSLYPVDGSNAGCTDLETGASVPVTNGPGGGFTVAAGADQAVSCTVYNVADPDAPPPATLQIDKQWRINGTTYAAGQQPDGLSAQLALDDRDANFDQEYGGYAAGDRVSAQEDTDIALPLCTLTGSSLVVDGITYSGNPAPVVLDAGANTGTLTNDITCHTRLTLVKQVQGGPADPTDWNLTAIAPDGAVPGPHGPSGSPAATAEITPGVVYSLAESGGNAVYAQIDHRDPTVAAPGSTGSWQCVALDSTGQPTAQTDDRSVNGGEAVPLGQWNQCTAVNQTASLTLQKIVDNAGGGTNVPADWTLTATPTGTAPPGLQPQSVAGSTAGSNIDVRPHQTYRLTESGPPGYQQTALQCDTGEDGTFVDTTTVTAGPLQRVICRFTNTFNAAPPPTTTPPSSTPPSTSPPTTAPPSSISPTSPPTTAPPSSISPTSPTRSPSSSSPPTTKPASPTGSTSTIPPSSTPPSTSSGPLAMTGEQVGHMAWLGGGLLGLGLLLLATGRRRRRNN